MHSSFPVYLPGPVTIYLLILDVLNLCFGLQLVVFSTFIEIHWNSFSYILGLEGGRRRWICAPYGDSSSNEDFVIWLIKPEFVIYFCWHNAVDLLWQIKITESWMFMVLTQSQDKERGVSGQGWWRDPFKGFLAQAITPTIPGWNSYCVWIFFVIC